MDYDSHLNEARTNAEQSETATDFRVSFESQPLSHGAQMFATYADKYNDWVARGKPPSPSMPSKWVWRRGGKDKPLLRHIAAEQGNRCSLCGEALDFDDTGPREPTYEHVMPRAKGGANHRNRLVAHRRCNSHKSDRLPTGCEIILLDAVNTRVYLLDPNREELSNA